MASKSKLSKLKSMKGSQIGSTKVPKDKKSSIIPTKSSTSALQRAPSKTQTYQKSHSVSSAGAVQNQLDYLRLAHDRAMREERRQNCCLCAVIVLSLTLAAALVPVAFVNRFSDLTGWNWTENAENLIADFFNDDNEDVLTTVPITAVQDQIIQETTTTTVSATIGKKINFMKPIINLTESCTKLRPEGCFYHKNVYPDNCRKTTCHSIIINLDILKHDKDLKFWVWKYSNETRSIDVEDWTPCAAGRLCMGGRCNDHPDALQHVLPRQQSGGIRVECDKGRSCVRFQGELIEGKKALKLTTCENRSCEKKAPDVLSWPNNMFANEMAVRFLSCSNPYPVGMEPGCFVDECELDVNALPDNFPAPLPQYDCLPFVMYDFCLDCTKFHHNLSCTRYMREHDSMHFAYGVRCRHSVIVSKKGTFCAGYYSCVSLYKDDPQTYAIRPIQKC